MIRTFLPRPISIHALRVEGDRKTSKSVPERTNFYPRPPGGGRLRAQVPPPRRAHYFYPRPPGGGRPVGVVSWFEFDAFLSTPSGWRATVLVPSELLEPFLYFYPRPPGGGRPIQYSGLSKSEKFLSTPSGWRATSQADTVATSQEISIHALRVEGDDHDDTHIFAETNFYPRPPGGGRPEDIEIRARADEFLSTPSGWRATTGTGSSAAQGALFLSTPSGWRATGGRCLLV